jgi:catechol 2,3-dioxygenase-like lactoylglutathione lyase family enzyme
MSVSAMNHFTILTDDLDATLAFYGDLLGLRPGERPPFTFPGAWLYAQGGSDPILHVIGGRASAELVKGVIDHMAFTAQDLPGAVGKLKARGLSYDLRRLPGYGTWQLFFMDPNGAKVELDFDAAEPAPAGWPAA